jgi:translation initiation factor 2B subunit (eIF-2B alpha/beta/delta family)
VTIHPEVLRHIENIREDVTHGASELARQALGAFILLAGVSRGENDLQLCGEIQEVAVALKNTRPAMASLKNAVNRLLKGLGSAEPATVRILLQSRAEELILASQQANSVIAGFTADLAADKDIIMTHSYSSTVSEALKAAYQKHRIRAIVTRSGAGRIGIKAANELAASGMEVTFIDDTAAGLYVAQADKVMVGADRVCCDGGLVNGAGTYLLALAAEKASIPFYVLCDSLKFDSATASIQAGLEEKDSSEVADPGLLDPRIGVKNPYFDVTPPVLITGFITENGMIKPQDATEFFTLHS